MIICVQQRNIMRTQKRSLSRLKTKVLLLCVLVFSLASPSAWAAPTLQLLSPTSNSCVPNSNPLQPGQLPGEDGIEAEFQISNVPLLLRFSESRGAEVRFSATVNGAPVGLTVSQLLPLQADTLEETEVIQLVAEEVSDGENLLLVVTAESTTPAGVVESVSQSVTFKLDRLPPAFDFSGQALDLLEQCSEAAAAQLLEIEPTVSDLFSNASLEVLDSASGCMLQRALIARDDCGAEGNAQELLLEARRPAEGPPEIMIEGIEEGETRLEATVAFFANTPDACLETLESTLSFEEAEAERFLSGTRITEAGEYQLSITATVCGQAPLNVTRNFRILEQPVANAGGPYAGLQGDVLILDGSGSFCPPELGGCQEYAWNFDLDDPFSRYGDGDSGGAVGEQVIFRPREVRDGVYRVGLRLTTQSGEVRFDFTTVDLGDITPVCDAGGPYRISQGVTLTLDGSESAPGTPEEEILAYDWDFGDGSSSGPIAGERGIFQSHRYRDEGVFTVTLTIYDEDSECQAETEVTVEDVTPFVAGLMVVDPPAPRDEFDPPQRFVEGDTLRFSAGSTSSEGNLGVPPIEPITAYSWDFGPNQASQTGPTLFSPLHQFTDSGDFEVCLTVSDRDSEARGCLPISVEDVDPLLPSPDAFSAIWPDFAFEGDELTFTAAGSRAGSLFDPLSCYHWDFGDGSEIPPVCNLEEVERRHIFNGDGEFQVTLEVADEDSRSAVTRPVYIDDARPDARFEIRGGVLFEGEEVLLSGAESEAGAPSDPIISYRWDFGDGTSEVGQRLDPLDPIETRHRWRNDGTYLVSLTVFDSDGSASTDERLVTVLNQPPWDGEIITDRAQVDFGELIRFEVRFTDVAADAVQIRWRMGEGTVFEGRRSVEHRYRELGIFTVRVFLDDGDGGVTELTYEIEVTPAGPSLTAPLQVEGHERSPLSFSVDARAAENGVGGFDGPIALRVLRSPRGMSWREELGEDPRDRRLSVSWTPGAGDAGRAIARFAARAPSGIERVVDVELIIRDTGGAALLAVGTGAAAGQVTRYTYSRDLERQLDRFEVDQIIDGGRLISDLLQWDQWLWMSSPLNNQVLVLSPYGEELLRRIPVSGRPYALAGGFGYLWAAGGSGGELTLIEPARLKVARQLLIPGLQGSSAALWLSDGERERLLLSGREGQLWLIDPSRAVAGQGQESVDVALPLEAPARRLYLWEEGTLVVALQGRAVVAWSSAALIDGRLEERWRINTHFALEDLAQVGEQLWGSSREGLRRFPVPVAGVQGEEDSIVDLEQRFSLVSLPDDLLGEPAVAVGGSRRVSNLSSALEPLSEQRGFGARLLYYLETPAED
ncbi:MAG: PKD domain-containing protein [Myxococcota bacterium]|nr:PKD domain-containing protein [Myxococcota bacterium]